VSYARQARWPCHHLADLLCMGLAVLVGETS
jgi:hypothetical protein